jgi:hypothetical protein
MTTPEPVYTHATPSGVKVYVVQKSERQFGWYLVSNGAIIDEEILENWRIKKDENQKDNTNGGKVLEKGK